MAQKGPSMIIAGIDPGKSGALAISYPDGSFTVLDVPLQKLKGKEVPAWSSWFSSWALAIEGVDKVLIESVASRPGQGISSSFNFGRSLGFVHGIAASAPQCAVEFVTPSVWKAKMGLLNSDKGASIEKAKSQLPGMLPYLTLKKHDGRAEAALLALYARRYLQ